jgi:hypothetical protein
MKHLMLRRGISFLRSIFSTVVTADREQRTIDPQKPHLRAIIIYKVFS